MNFVSNTKALNILYFCVPHLLLIKDVTNVLIVANFPILLNTRLMITGNLVHFQLSPIQMYCSIKASPFSSPSKGAINKACSKTDNNNWLTLHWGRPRLVTLQWQISPLTQCQQYFCFQ